MRSVPALLAALLLAPAAVAVAAPAVTTPFRPSELRPGMKLAVLGVGERYSLHDLSTAVGPQGRVYVLPMQPPGSPEPEHDALEPNVRVSPGGSPGGLGLPEPLDRVWLTNAGEGRAPYLAAAFSGLKSGGELLVRPRPADPAAFTADAQAAGFTVEAAAPGDTGLRFRKP